MATPRRIKINDSGKVTVVTFNDSKIIDEAEIQEFGQELYDLVVDGDQMESRAYSPMYDSVRLYCQGRIQQLMTNDALRVDF